MLRMSFNKWAIGKWILVILNQVWYNAQFLMNNEYAVNFADRAPKHRKI